MADDRARFPDDGEEKEAAPNLDPGELEDLSDEEIAEIEQSLHEALEGHRLPEEETTEAPIESADERYEAALDAIEARINLLADHAGPPPIPQPDGLEDLESRASSVADRAATMRQVHENQPSGPNARHENYESSRGLGFGLSIAYGLLGLPIFGFVVGRLIDGTGPARWQTWLALVGIGLGLFFMIFQLQRQHRGSK